MFLSILSTDIPSSIILLILGIGYFFAGFLMSNKEHILTDLNNDVEKIKYKLENVRFETLKDILKKIEKNTSKPKRK